MSDMGFWLTMFGDNACGEVRLTTRCIHLNFFRGKVVHHGLALICAAAVEIADIAVVGRKIFLGIALTLTACLNGALAIVL